VAAASAAANALRATKSRNSGGSISEDGEGEKGVVYRGVRRSPAAHGGMRRKSGDDDVAQGVKSMVTVAGALRHRNDGVASGATRVDISAMQRRRIGCSRRSVAGGAYGAAAAANNR
jgi:hypothetical protein